MKSDHSILNRVYHELKTKYGEKASSIIEFKDYYSVSFPVNNDCCIRIDKKTGNISKIHIDPFDFSGSFYWERPDFIKEIEVKEIDP